MTDVVIGLLLLTLPFILVFAGIPCLLFFCMVAKCLCCNNETRPDLYSDYQRYLSGAPAHEFRGYKS